MDPISQTSKELLKRLSLFCLIVVVGQVFLGAWTASNYAALACGSEFPGCQSSLWPEMNLRGGFDFLQTVGPNYLGGLFDNESRVAIHYLHRIGALIVTLLLVVFLVMAHRHLSHKLLKWSIGFVGSTLAIQILLGISNVVWLVPLPVAVAHNAVGALLLISLVNFKYQLRRIE